MSYPAQIRVLNLLSILVVILVTGTEFFLVEPQLRDFYLYVRIANVAVFAWMLIDTRHIEKVWYGNMWTINFYVYCYVGEFCRPLYAVAIMQIMVLHASCFRQSRHSYWILHSVGTLIFTAILIHSWDRNIHRLADSSVADQVSILICSMITMGVLHFRLESLRRGAELKTKKLALIGGYATSLIHDIKNLSASPLLYSEILRQPTTTRTPDEVAKLSNLLYTDLKKLEHVVKEIYDSSKFETPDEDEVSLAKLCRGVQEILGHRLDGIAVHIEGEALVRTDRRVLQVILQNLFYNAVAAIKHQPGEDRGIRIRLTPRQLRFSSSSVPEEMKVQPGLGLFLMDEFARHSNLRLQTRIEGREWITEIEFL